MSDQSGYSVEELKKLLQSQPEDTVVTVEFTDLDQRAE